MKQFVSLQASADIFAREVLQIQALSFSKTWEFRFFLTQFPSTKAEDLLRKDRRTKSSSDAHFKVILL